MGRLFVCTVGTSLLDSYGSPTLEVRHEGQNDEFSNELYEPDHQIIQAWLARVAAAKPLSDDETLGHVRGRMLRRLCDRPWQLGDWHSIGGIRRDHRRWSQTVGAELATLVKLAPSAPNGDRIVFICSDTAESVFCAHHCWVASQEWGWAIASQASGAIQVLNGMNPDQLDRDGARPNLADTLQRQLPGLLQGLPSPRDDELIVIGSGGFKSAAPAMYHGILRLAGPIKRSMVFQYESSDRLISYQFSPSGHSRIDPDGLPEVLVI